MYIYRNVPFEIIYRFGIKNILLFISYGIVLSIIHHYLETQYQFKLHIPSALIGPMGVAVAIYASFKNSQSYDRTWEARKNWGAIATQVKLLTSTSMVFIEDKTFLHHFLQRNIAMMNAHKLQLRKKMPHSRKFPSMISKFYFGEPTAQQWEEEVYQYISEEDKIKIQHTDNRALALVFLQKEYLKTLHKNGTLGLFELMNLMDKLSAICEHMGKNERIKSTPFPRQYGFFSKSFVVVYIIMLPFGILDMYKAFSIATYVAFVIIFTIIAWLFVTIELVGDHSEDPFENFITDIPMSTIIRNTEVDIKQILLEKNIPQRLASKDGYAL